MMIYMPSLNLWPHLKIDPSVSIFYFLLEQYPARRYQPKGTRTPAQVLMDSSGSWEDDRPSEQIIKELKAERRNSKK
jgi:hypothetical protein